MQNFFTETLVTNDYEKYDNMLFTLHWGAFKQVFFVKKLQLRALDYIWAGCCFNVLGSLTTFQLESWNKWYLIWKPWYRAPRIRNEIGFSIVMGNATPTWLKRNTFSKIGVAPPRVKLCQNSFFYVITTFQGLKMMYITLS